MDDRVSPGFKDFRACLRRISRRHVDKPRIIFETDITRDVDDVLALTDVGGNVMRELLT